MRDLWRPAAVAAVLLTPFLVLGACKGGESASKVVPEPDEKPAVAGFTHDGAVPIAVIRSFEDARRAVATTKPNVAAATTCSFLTTLAQDATVERAHMYALVGRKADCADAMQALVEHDGAPARWDSFTVTRAEDETTEIVVVRSDDSAEAYTLTGSRADGVWYIDDIATAEVPEVEEAPEAPVGELLPSMKKK